jgi:hypothetical protein
VWHGMHQTELKTTMRFFGVFGSHPGWSAAAQIPFQRRVEVRSKVLFKILNLFGMFLLADLISGMRSRVIASRALSLHMSVRFSQSLSMQAA